MNVVPNVNLLRSVGFGFSLELFFTTRSSARRPLSCPPEVGAGFDVVEEGDATAADRATGFQGRDTKERRNRGRGTWDPPETEGKRCLVVDNSKEGARAAKNTPKREAEEVGPRETLRTVRANLEEEEAIRAAIVCHTGVEFKYVTRNSP